MNQSLTSVVQVARMDRPEAVLSQLRAPPSDTGRDGSSVIVAASLAAMTMSGRGVDNARTSTTDISLAVAYCCLSTRRGVFRSTGCSTTRSNIVSNGKLRMGPDRLSTWVTWPPSMCHVTGGDLSRTI